MFNLALKALSASNFASFADKVSFTTQIDKNKKEFSQCTFSVGDESLNKVSYIYGANGSGKSFLCKILIEIQNMLTWSTINLNAQAMQAFSQFDLRVPTFKFDLSYVNQPISFSIDIMLDKVTYHYEFSVMGKEIIHELLTKKYRRTEILLERHSPMHEDIFLRSDFKSFDIYKSTVKKESLCLAVANVLNYPLATEIVSAINSIYVINMASPVFQPVDPHAAYSESRKAKYLEILKKADPTLRTLDVSIKEDDAKLPIPLGDFEDREIIAKRTTLSVNTGHAVYRDDIEEGYCSINFFTEQSLGTVKLFSILPYVFDVLEKGGVLVLDEIENGLHLLLVKGIINLFLDESQNPHNAQLICTTHQPLLVDKNTRRDQVWVTNKNVFGKSYINRLSTLSTSRAKINITNKLLEGAFGCNPEPFFDN